MKKILALYGSPRRKGNTTILLEHAAQGSTLSKPRPSGRGDEGLITFWDRFTQKFKGQSIPFKNQRRRDHGIQGKSDGEEYFSCICR
jgi:hypothetical protein